MSNFHFSPSSCGPVVSAGMSIMANPGHSSLMISAMAELKDDLSQKQNVVFRKALEQWTKLTIA